LLTNAGVDQVEAFLDFLADGRRRGNVIALRVKAGLVRGVVNGDQLSLGTCVREGALLHDRLRPVLTLADRLNVAALLSDDVIARFVTAGIQVVRGALNNRLRKRVAQKADRSRALCNAKMSAGETRADSKSQVTPRYRMGTFGTGLRELRATKVSANYIILRRM